MANDLEKRNLTVVSGASSNHFHCLQNLLYSLQRLTARPRIIIFDLGLRNWQRNLLNKLAIEVRSFPFDRYPSHVNISTQAGGYAWKPIIISDIVEEVGGLVLWLDAGNIVFDELDGVSDALGRSGIYSPLSPGTIKRWTHPTTLSLMQVDTALLNSPNRNAAIVGINANFPGARDLVLDWKHWALTKECIVPVGSSRKNHRQDQAILTILMCQYQRRYQYHFEDRKLGIGTHFDGVCLKDLRRQEASLSPETLRRLANANRHLRKLKKMFHSLCQFALVSLETKAFRGK